jgi:hypothetical protein
MIVVAASATAALMSVGGRDPAGAAPTCASTLGIAVHGQHIVGDYVTGIGRANIAWPPQGGVVGQAVAGNGAAIPGGPGPGFHFIEGFAPGASFCNGSSSPGLHP